MVRVLLPKIEFETILLMGAAALAACSGSDGSSGPNSSGTNSGGAYTVSPTSLVFRVNGGDPLPPPQTVHVTANDGVVYVKTETSGAAVLSAMTEGSGTKSIDVSVQAVAPAAVPNGTSTGSVSIIGCVDPVCSSEVAGSPKVVTVTYEKTVAGITGTPSSLTFTQSAGASAPPAQMVMLRDLGNISAAWTASINYQSGGGGWLTVTPSSGTGLPASASVGVLAQPAGKRTATIQFVRGTVTVFDVPVTYAVLGDFQVMPASLDVVGAFDAATPVQDLSLSDGAGGSYAWSSRIEYTSPDPGGWLSVYPAAGPSLPATVSVTFGMLPDRLTHLATLYITAAGTDYPVSIDYRTP